MSLRPEEVSISVSHVVVFMSLVLQTVLMSFELEGIFIYVFGQFLFVRGMRHVSSSGA